MHLFPLLVDSPTVDTPLFTSDEKSHERPSARTQAMLPSGPVH